MATRLSGKSTKRLKTETEDLELEIPRDREGSLDQLVVTKGQRRPAGFDEKVTRSTPSSTWTPST